MALTCNQPISFFTLTTNALQFRIGQGLLVMSGTAVAMLSVFQNFYSALSTIHDDLLAASLRL